MEDFVAENLLEDRLRLRVVGNQIAVDREAAGGRLLGDVQEGEETMIRLVLDREIVESVPPGSGDPLKSVFNRLERVRRSAAPRWRNRSP